jgi:hypothetical protein
LIALPSRPHRGSLPHDLHNLEAIHVGQPEVQDRKVGSGFQDDSNGLLAVFRASHDLAPKLMP